MSEVTFKKGDKVRVQAGIKTPTHNWGRVTPGDVGTVSFVGAGGMMLVDFQKQSGWTAEMSEMELVNDSRITQQGGQVTPLGQSITGQGTHVTSLIPTVAKPKRKSPEKVLAYGVMQKGALHEIVYDRDWAREVKANLGGKSAGATIVVLTAGKEIR